ncbi:MAG: extracellular solute-binding protein, partial [Caldilineaceae bacterium]
MNLVRAFALCIFVALAATFMVGCGASQSEPSAEPQATQQQEALVPAEPVAPSDTPEAQSEPTVAPTEAPTVAPPTSEPTPAEPVTIEFWTSDYQGPRMAAYRAVADRYMAANPGVNLVIVPVDESTITSRLREAAQGNVLPDIARLGLERLPSLASEGLLDRGAASAAIDAVGRDDFRDGPLAMVIDPQTGMANAVPYDGWIQALWYRRDLFEGEGLETPVTWDQINVACDVLGGSDAVPYALTLPTDPQLNYVHQVFEQVAMSNNAWPFDEAGNVTMNSP